jgi:DNA polymerase-1
MKKNYGVITSLDELETHINRIDEDVYAFDIETGYLGPPREKFSLHPETALIAGFSFTNSEHWARYVPLAHDDAENLDNQAVAELLWPWFISGKGVAHNAKFEKRHLSRYFRQHLWDHRRYGDAVRAANGYFPVYSDTMAEAYVLADYAKYGLKYLVRETFQHDMIELWELFPDLPQNKRAILRFNVLELSPQAVEYACEDSLWTLQLHRENYTRAKTERSLVYQLEMETIQVVCEMEDHGVQYDWSFLRAAAQRAQEFQSKLDPEIQAELSAMVGQPVQINLGSPKQLQEILFTQLGMKTSHYTAGTRNKPKAERTMSTDAEALKELAAKHPVVRKILDYKEIKTLINNFLVKYERDFTYAADGRVHPDHLQMFVITGRFALSDPNYQNTPKRYHYELASGETFDLNFRDAIVAPPDHYLLGFDYEQAELRGIAGEAHETALIDAFARGIDPHVMTGSLMLGIPVEQVGEKERSLGKMLNFAVDYGMKVQSLAERLGIPVAEAQPLFSQFHASYPHISQWADGQIAFGKANGYVLSHFGRHCPIWEFGSTERWIYNKGERACINYPIQSSATGDVPKAAMVRARKVLVRAGLMDRVHLVMNIHDALNFYVHKSLSPQQVIDVLEPAVIFPINGWPQMAADWYIGATWGSVHHLKKDPAGVWRVVDGKKKVEEPEVPITEDNPETAVDAAADPATPSTTPLPQTECVIVELQQMPDQTTWAQFLALLDSIPGRNVVELRTPGGTILLEKHRTGLGAAHEADVAELFGQATVVMASSELARS